MSSPRSRARKHSGKQRRSNFIFALVLITLIGVCALAYIAFRGNAPLAFFRASSNSGSPEFKLEDERTVFAQYAGSESCKECHEEAYELWKTSNHALAERPLQPGPDRAAFEPSRSFPHGTQTTAVNWTNGTATVNSVGLSGKVESHAVARVIGHEPLRQFLVPFPGGRLQALEASWDPRSNHWFNVYGQEDRRPGEWGHWTGRGMNWNSMCAGCHNTRLRRNYDEAADTFRTTMAEQSVGCEACHGPLKEHNDWQKLFGKSGRKDPTVTKLTRDRILDYCGFCHARRSDLTGDFKPGDRFSDHFALALVDETDRYYADGQVRDEDYEYGSFLGSRMHLRGVSCVDCHNAHSYKTILPGNWLCLRCHNGSFTNAPVIDPVAHSRHKVFGYDTNGVLVNFDLMAYKPKEIKETGGECVNCHMPQTVYMQRHWRHDHGFTSPDPLLTKQSGIPNACNRCHQDKDADWALKYCEEWYGTKMDRPARHRAQVIAQAREGVPGARDGLLALMQREESPYWQAVALGLLRPWALQPEVIAEMRQRLEYTNHLVRAAAARALEGAQADAGSGAATALQARLKDPVRSVRLAAAWSLRATLNPASPAGRELLHSLDTNADQPIGRMQRGVYFHSRNDPESALRDFRQAVAWDPYSPPFHHELAIVLSALNRPQEALATLQEACRLAPRDAESRYQLGLAWNETGDLKHAAEQLAIAVQLEPRHARAWYNLGLAQNALGQFDAAIESLLRAESIAPGDARIPYARATILARLGRTGEAAAALRRALEIDPSFEDARQLLRSLPN